MEPQYHRGNPGAGRTSQDHAYYDDDDDFSAEEIFNLFFGYSGRLFALAKMRNKTHERFCPLGTSRTHRRRPQQQRSFRFNSHSTNTQTQNVSDVGLCSLRHRDVARC